MDQNSARATEPLLENLSEGSIMAWAHVNLLGLYDFRDLTSVNDSEFSANDVMEFRIVGQR